MEFFHRATNFPFMSTRKVWYGLSVVLIADLAGLAGHARTESRRGFHRRSDRAGDLSDRRQSRRGRAQRWRAPAIPMRRSRSSAPRATSRSACRRPSRAPRRCARSIEQILRGVDRRRADPAGRGDRPAGRRRARAQRDAGADRDAAADLRLYRAALSHLAALVRRDPRGAARSDPGARRVLAHAAPPSI